MQVRSLFPALKFLHLIAEYIEEWTSCPSELDKDYSKHFLKQRCSYPVEGMSEHALKILEQDAKKHSIAYINASLENLRNSKAEATAIEQVPLENTVEEITDNAHNVECVSDNGRVEKVESEEQSSVAERLKWPALASYSLEWGAALEYPFHSTYIQRHRDPSVMEQESIK